MINSSYGASLYLYSRGGSFNFSARLIDFTWYNSIPYNSSRTQLCGRREEKGEVRVSNKIRVQEYSVEQEQSKSKHRQGL